MLAPLEILHLVFFCPNLNAGLLRAIYKCRIFIIIYILLWFRQVYIVLKLFASISVP